MFKTRKQLLAKIKSLEAQLSKSQAEGFSNRRNEVWGSREENKQNELMCEIGTVLSLIDKKLDRIEASVNEVLLKHEAQSTTGDTEKVVPGDDKEPSYKQVINEWLNGEEKTGK